MKVCDSHVTTSKREGGRETDREREGEREREREGGGGRESSREGGKTHRVVHGISY